jgi:hypothetical protein
MLMRWGFLVSIFLSISVFAQSPQKPPAITAERVRERMTIDGILTESVWQRPGLTQFTQKFPVEGALPSQRTEVWVAYDDEALYVAARMHDSAPDSIVQFLARRDADVTADWFAFYVDPYYDRRSGFFFVINPAGTLQDGTLYNDDWDDDTWDGVWEGKARIDDKGWTAEMKIPYSQLRFQKKEVYLWGVNFRRSIGRLSERDFVVYTPRKESGFVSRFADLNGIENIEPPQQVEILPYVTSRAEYTQHAPGDPFNNGSKYLPGTGVDMKIGLGTNLTLNATVNPDFGQVEIDPAVVNLSDIESFFEEKRPFFIEGANTFNFGRGGASSNWSFNWGNPDFFYSRRIGRSPQGSLPGYDYADLPLGTHILGAGKLTGKIGENLSLGFVQAVTKREFAQLDMGGSRSTMEVEPLTSYSIARVQKEFNEGKQGLGVISTYTGRSFEDQRLRDEINSGAFTGGIDGWTALDADKTYVLTGWLGMSSIAGTTKRMIDLQRSSRHYLQRPDAKNFSVDSSATSFTGYSGRFAINKQKGSVMLNTAVGFIDPRFETNDLGFLWRGDVVNGHFGIGYKWTDPTEYYRFLSIMAATFASYDFDGNKIWSGLFTNGNLELPNFYTMFWAFAYNPATINNRKTRGGPLMLSPVGREVDLGIMSDSRQSVVAQVSGFIYSGGGGQTYNIELSTEIKPAPNVNIKIGPSFSRDMTQAQWVNAIDDPTAANTYGRRYVFAYLDQKTVTANIRLNWTFTPQLSLQLYAQPLISSGHYADFKELARPLSYDFLRYGEGGSSLSKSVSSSGDVSYIVDPDGNGPAPAFAVGNLDFNYKSLRGNAVLRWEYRPGSALYLVWTQSRSDNESMGDFQLNHSLSRLADAHPDNIFMLKFTYWWNM